MDVVFKFSKRTSRMDVRISGNGSRKKGQSGSQKLVLAVEKKAT